jgi:hypothetical protein
MTLLKLLLTDTAGNECPAVSVNAVGEMLARDTDPLTAAVR